MTDSVASLAGQREAIARFQGIDSDPTSEYVLYAFGAAGTGAASWGPFRERLSGLAEVRAARLPGRETRHRDAPVHSVTNQIADLGPYLRELVAQDDRPYLVVGLCWGTITAFEMSRFLQQTAARPPETLVVANDVAPAQLAEQAERAREYGDEEFHAWCAENLHLPNELDNPDIFRFFQPMLRADIIAATTYEYHPSPALHCPVVALCSDAAIAAGWQDTTQVAFTVRQSDNPAAMDSLAAAVTEMLT